MCSQDKCGGSSRSASSRRAGVVGCIARAHESGVAYYFYPSALEVVERLAFGGDAAQRALLGEIVGLVPVFVAPSPRRTSAGDRIYGAGAMVSAALVAWVYQQPGANFNLSSCRIRASVIAGFPIDADQYPLEMAGTRGHLRRSWVLLGTRWQVVRRRRYESVASSKAQPAFDSTHVSAAFACDRGREGTW
ncbi:MAG: hypothetical protein U0165_06015 [Polyangiaceae bacterium]